MSSAELPHGWTAGYDPSTQRIFFANHLTQQTTFEDPRPLPPGWAMITGPDGKVFFADHTTQTTTWQDPRPAPLITATANAAQPQTLSPTAAASPQPYVPPASPGYLAGPSPAYVAQPMPVASPPYTAPAPAPGAAPLVPHHHAPSSPQAPAAAVAAGPGDAKQQAGPAPVPTHKILDKPLNCHEAMAQGFECCVCNRDDSSAQQDDAVPLPLSWFTPHFDPNANFTWFAPYYFFPQTKYLCSHSYFWFGFVIMPLIDLFYVGMYFMAAAFFIPLLFLLWLLLSHGAINGRKFNTWNGLKNTVLCPIAVLEWLDQDPPAPEALFTVSMCETLCDGQPRVLALTRNLVNDRPPAAVSQLAIPIAFCLDLFFMVLGSVYVIVTTVVVSPLYVLHCFGPPRISTDALKHEPGKELYYSAPKYFFGITKGLLKTPVWACLPLFPFSVPLDLMFITAYIMAVACWLPGALALYAVSCCCAPCMPGKHMASANGFLSVWLSPFHVLDHMDQGDDTVPSPEELESCGSRVYKYRAPWAFRVTRRILADGPSVFLLGLPLALLTDVFHLATYSLWTLLWAPAALGLYCLCGPCYKVKCTHGFLNCVFNSRMGFAWYCNLCR